MVKRGDQTIAVLQFPVSKNESEAVVIYLYWTPAANIDLGLVSPF